MEGNIVLKPDLIGHIGNLPVTNTLLTSWVVMLVLLTVGFLASRNIKLVPSGLQNFFEFIVEGVYSTVEDSAHSRAKIFFPFIITFFLYILVGNLMGLLPGVGTIGLNEVHDGKEVFVPLFRSINSDLNMTLGLALVSAFLTHFFAIKYLGLKGYLSKWFSLNMFGVFLFVGQLYLQEIHSRHTL